MFKNVLMQCMRVCKRDAYREEKKRSDDGGTWLNVQTKVASAGDAEGEAKGSEAQWCIADPSTALFLSAVAGTRTPWQSYPDRHICTV